MSAPTAVMDQPARSGGQPPTEPKPLTEAPPSRAATATLWTFVILPFLAVLAAVPLAWGFGLVSWLDLGLFAAMYLISGLGVTAGFHRYLTHGSFKAKRGLRVGLTIAGSLSLQGQPIQWVADHRRHHAFSDREGDPHSPWRYGTTPVAVIKGLWWAHWGWLLHREPSNRERFAPDLLADKDMRRVDRAFVPFTVASLALPGILGGLFSGSWKGALTGVLWGGLVRVGVLHHVTWSINSICHVFGERPFSTRDGDKAANFWPLAVISFGESWHNLHHADPTCARHGVLRGQVDPTARLIWLFERLGWVHDVRWPRPERLAAKLTG